MLIGKWEIKIPSISLSLVLNKLYNISKSLYDTSPMFSSGSCKDPKDCILYNALSLAEGGIGKYVLMFIIQMFVFYSIILIIDMQLLNMLWYKMAPLMGRGPSTVSPDEDGDVAAERRRVNDMTEVTELDVVTLDGLTKVMMQLFRFNQISSERYCNS